MTEKCTVNNKARIAELFNFFDIRHGVTEFGVCPAWFQSCFGLVFPHYNPIIVFWNGNLYSVLLYFASI